MNIKNLASETVSWFCFNKEDSVKLIALASGDLDKSGEKSYTPPDNGTNKYTIRYTKKGGGQELAAATLTSTQNVTLEESSKGNYIADVTS